MTEQGPSPDLPLVGRLAPSPTGLLHLGHARTFLFAWWSIRARGGRIVLRIEDLDAGRASPEFRDAALRDLEWLGLDWDGTPSVQTEHLERLESAVVRLLAMGRAYPCVCSRSDLRTAQSAPHPGDREPRYPGTCRGRFATPADAERESGRAAGIRLKVPAGDVTIRDAVSGIHTLDVQASVGDFLLARRGGAPAYQLAVVVDDAAEGVTEVLRGDDLLPSTFRQWHVQVALGLPHPTWVHVPLVLDATGRRLAKRADSLSLAELRARGADPRAIVRWVADSAGMPGGGLVKASELTPHFSLERLDRRPVRADGAVLERIVAS
ncbi:MAG TPA: tRNA glutamyl-Q(34) synthetase GluQRS [Polyangiaceae bacterium]|nr:tRNA glutamyl-Q(34) synthetase GluQRS [Polyangiaceae bacterium]